MTPPSEMRLTRRRLLRDAGLAAVAATAIGQSPVRAARRGRSGGRTVAVLGGGIAGLTAAHELAERGFDVTVYERRAWGGKARSVKVPRSACGGRRPLPGEHGFRIEFGFYRNLPETLRRIPFGSNSNGVFDNLVGASQGCFSRAGKRDLVLPLAADPRGHTPAQIEELVLGLLLQADIPPQSAAHFTRRFMVYLSSCDARRVGEWENVSWSDFIGSDRYGGDYRKLLGEIPTHFLQASKAGETSVKFAGWFMESTIYNLLGRGANGPFDRVLSMPTNEAWILPWVKHLRRLGVQLRRGYDVTKLELRNDRIVGVRAHGPHGPETIEADWYVCALPVERARRLWNPSLLAADPQLARMQALDTDWMNGIQFYLRERTPLVRGHIICLDSPWLVSGISQAQFWDRDFARDYGDGQARDCLSTIVSDWNAPGILYGRAARELGPRQIAREVWEQLKWHVNDSGREPLTDDLLHSWYLGPGLVRLHGRLHSEDPLVLPSVGAWPDRPDVATAIPNLVLAGDYLKSDWQVANMETASYNARRAVNALLERSGSHEPTCAALGPYRPPEWEPLKRADADRYRRGQPNPFDRPLSSAELANLLETGAKS